MCTDEKVPVCGGDENLVPLALNRADTLVFDLDFTLLIAQVKVVRTPGSKGVCVLEVVGDPDPNLARQKVGSQPAPFPSRRDPRTRRTAGARLVDPFRLRQPEADAALQALS